MQQPHFSFSRLKIGKRLNGFVKHGCYGSRQLCGFQVFGSAKMPLLNGLGRWRGQGTVRVCLT